MSHKRINPALSESEWTEWRAYKAELATTSSDPERAAIMALQTMARNNDLLPDDSPYKITHLTVYDLRSAAACLRHEGHDEQAASTLAIANMLFACLGPT